MSNFLDGRPLACQDVQAMNVTEVASSSPVDPLELQAKFEQALSEEKVPEYVPTTADVFSLVDDTAQTEIKAPLSAVELHDLEMELRGMLEEHKNAGGRFSVNVHGITAIASEDGALYMRERGAAQDLLGIMALGYAKFIDVSATVRTAFDLLPQEVDALEVGWHAYQLRHAAPINGVSSVERFISAQEVSARVADVGYRLACEFMGQ